MELTQLVPTKSQYLRQDDVGDGITVTIKGFKKVEIGDDNEERVIMLFNENVNPMVLNNTNAQLLAAATGETTVEGVKGKAIEVFVDPTVMFGGKRTGGLRIRKASGQPTATAANDDISDLLG